MIIPTHASSALVTTRFTNRCAHWSRTACWSNVAGANPEKLVSICAPTISCERLSSAVRATSVA